MSKVLQVVAFGLVSALSPALLFAEGKSATCDSGMYAGFEVFLNAAKNKVKAADKDADAAKKRELADKLDELIDGSQAVDLEGLIDSVVGGEDSTFAQALSKATTKDGVSIASVQTENRFSYSMPSHQQMMGARELLSKPQKKASHPLCLLLSAKTVRKSKVLPLLILC